MPINIERFIKGKRFTQEFDLDDPLNQVLPKVGVGSVIYNAIVGLINASKQTLGISGNTLSISGGNSVTLPSTPPQTLSSSGQTICISGGNCVTLPEYDNQTLTIIGQTLYISGGNAVTIPSSSPVAGSYIVVSGNTVSVNLGALIPAIFANVSCADLGAAMTRCGLAPVGVGSVF